MSGRKRLATSSTSASTARVSRVASASSRASRTATKTSPNQDLRLDAAEARRVSPLFWKMPDGRTLDAVVGSLELNEFLRQSKVIVENWGARGVATRYAEIAGTNHFTVLDALADADSAMSARVAQLAEYTSTLAL